MRNAFISYNFILIKKRRIRLNLIYLYKILQNTQKRENWSHTVMKSNRDLCKILNISLNVPKTNVNVSQFWRESPNDSYFFFFGCSLWLTVYDMLASAGIRSFETNIRR